jgi:hypothetical protein
MSAAFLTLPRVVRIALELGLNREAAVMVWRLWAGKLRLHASSLPSGAGRVDAPTGSGAFGGLPGLLQERR